MHKKIEKVLRQIEDTSLRKVIDNIMLLHGDAFVTQPGGCTRHHAYKGGLMDHSCNTALLAASIVDRYPGVNPKINKSLAVTGALLHDIGKVKCYQYEKEKDRYISTQKSRWHHHIPIGFHIVATNVEMLVAKGEMEEVLADHLLHIIVSHHGRVEYRSPRAPRTDEAFVVSQADLIDAYMGAPDHAKRTFNKEKM